jgi:hypothetical protein
MKDQLKGREVRLFSSVSISSEREAEMRATSAFLSVLKAVSEFGRLVIKIANGPAGKLECYTEIQFPQRPKIKGPRPDGVIIVTRGKKEWKALLEIKVGSNGLEQNQFDTYQDIARDYNFDALITVSNQPALPNGHPPLKIDKRKLRSIDVIHLSWERLLSEAQLLSWQNEISDEDQQFILMEWIRYINDPNSKIVVTPRVGSYWRNLLTQSRSGRLPTVKSEVEEFVSTWIGFLRIEAFKLRAMLGENVEVRLRRAEQKEPELYIKRLIQETIENNRIESSLKIPYTAGDLSLIFDLKAKAIFIEVHVLPPKDKTTRGQIGWIVGQLKKLKDLPKELVLIADWRKRGFMSYTPIFNVSETRDDLLFSLSKEQIANDNEIKLFRIRWETKIPTKSSEFFASIGTKMEEFYSKVVAQLKSYTPPPPRVSGKVEVKPDESEDIIAKGELEQNYSDIE